MPSTEPFPPSFNQCIYITESNNLVPINSITFKYISLLQLPQSGRVNTIPRHSARARSCLSTGLGADVFNRQYSWLLYSYTLYQTKSSISIFKWELDYYTSTGVLCNFSIPIVKAKKLWRALLMGEVVSLVSLWSAVPTTIKAFTAKCVLSNTASRVL